ncbi:MAG: DUF2914 domain-containing protein [bacterium]|nr:DUF2914 domain-containing protein [bacterium]
MYEKVSKAKDFFKKYDRYLTASALMLGFIVDALTLKRIDQLYGNLTLISYLILVSTGIFLIHYFEVRKQGSKYAEKVSQIVPLVIQFAFGGLFSGFTIFYLRSGSVAASWPFIVILLGLLIGNEMLRKQYARLIFQITAQFIAVFFFMIFFVPVIINSMGAFVFLLSGAIALLIILLFISLLNTYIPEQIERSKKYLTYSIGSVLVVINILYFTNLIPPIPLSLKSGGVYHEVSINPTGYVGVKEKRSFWSKFQIFENMHVVRAKPLYVYSAVFAPTDIKTQIVHHWQLFDTKTNRWVSVNRIPYLIAGGNDQGYRGYSVKTNLSEGDWRVDVETARGQVIGRIHFEVEFVHEVPQLERKAL